VVPGQRIASSDGRPGANGGDANKKIANVSSPGSQAGGRNHQPKRAQRPHSIIQCRKVLDGPAMRPKTPPAVENGVGKPAAPQGRAKCRPGKESLANSHPPFVPV